MRHVLMISILITMVSCIEPFEPSFRDSQQTLVIDGLITDELKRHEVVVKYTSPLDSLTLLPVEKASVRVIVNDNTTLSLTEEAPGLYKTELFQGNINDSFKLSVIISEGVTFESASVLLKPTPPIDTVYGRFAIIPPLNERGLEVLVDVSDQSSASHFLRWEWEETFEINSPYPTRFEWLGGSNLRELDLDSSRFCWDSKSSNFVHIASTNSFSKADISQFRLRFIREFETQIQSDYSIEVKQYSLTASGFEYWRTLRDIGERQGSIFDLQPGLVIGNIKATGSNNQVLGYFDAAQVRTKRIFLSPVDLTEFGLTLDQSFAMRCTDQIETVSAAELGNYMESFGETRNIIGQANDEVYLTGPKICTDCTERGTSTRPVFWP